LIEWAGVELCDWLIMEKGRQQRSRQADHQLESPCCCRLWPLRPSLSFERATPRKPDSIDSKSRLDLAANSPESETHLAFVDERPLTDVQLEYPHTSPHSVAPRFGWGDFLSRRECSLACRYPASNVRLSWLQEIGA
jgi:hypothetical protein